jgi:hypothetical protein
MNCPVTIGPLAMGYLEETLNEAFAPVPSMLPKVVVGDIQLSFTVIECCDATFKEVPVAKTILHLSELAIWRAWTAERKHRDFAAVAKVAIDESRQFRICFLRAHPLQQGINRGGEDCGATWITTRKDVCRSLWSGTAVGTDIRFSAIDCIQHMVCAAKTRYLLSHPDSEHSRRLFHHLFYPIPIHFIKEVSVHDPLGVIVLTCLFIPPMPGDGWCRCA